MPPYLALGFTMLGLAAYAAAAVPCAVVMFAAKGAEAGWKAARQATYRRAARIDRDFAKRCTARLHDLRDAAPSVWRRALRELARERAALEAERAEECRAFGAGGGSAAARSERARARRDAAWRAWFTALERAAAKGRTPPRELLACNPAHRGAPIRRLCERTVHGTPSPDAVRGQWEQARGRGRVEEKIRLGSMLLDVEASVDSSLVRNAEGEIVGRRGGLREWLDENCRDLMKHYAALMGYRRLAAEFRDAHDLADPCPVSLLLEEEPAAEKKLPPKQRAALAAARRRARARLAEPEAATVKAFVEKLQQSWAEPRDRMRRLA